MCRSIKKLRFVEREATDVEIAEAARQFVRKVSGYRTPSKVNADAFERAIQEIAISTRALLNELETPAGAARQRELPDR